MDNCQRPPLITPEKNNAGNPAVRKPGTREIPSRYKSVVSSAPVSTPGTPRRAASPTIFSRSSPAPGASQPKRALSAERRRPTTPLTRASVPSSTRASVPSSPRASSPSSSSSMSTTPVRDAVTETKDSARRALGSRTPDGLWPSLRNLSSSFQSETISEPLRRIEKVASSSTSDDITKIPTNAGSERKRTPLRGRNAPDQSENFRPLESAKVRVIEQHHWPAMLGGRTNALSRSVDLTDKVSRPASSVTMSRGLSPKKTLPNSTPQKSLEVTRRLSFDGNARMEQDVKPIRESSYSQAPERSSSVTRASRTQLLTSQALRHSSSPSRSLITPSTTFRPLLSPSRRPSTPVPSRSLTTPSTTFRGLLSPSRTRPSTPVPSSSNSIRRVGFTTSVLNHWKGMKTANHIEDAHQRRLLYNYNLQLRLANAQAEDTLSIQKMRSESDLCSVSHDIKQLRDSVCMRKIDVQRMQQEMKLNLIIEEQMAYLEHWVAVEREYCASLSGAVDAIKASTLCLPVTGGAKADIFDVKNAVSSAVDVMQAMGSSICYLLSKAENTKMLVAELSAVAAKEKAMLDECRDLLASAASMEVQESSLRAHLIQLKQYAFKLE